MKRLEKGSKVRYIGETNGAYEKDKIYEVYGYDDELGAYGVMSDLDEVYCVAPEDLESVEGGITNGSSRSDTGR